VKRDLIRRFPLALAQGNMLKWILTLVIAIFLLGIIGPHLARFIRFGQITG
jgi:hypothetical protein